MKSNFALWLAFAAPLVTAGSITLNFDSVPLAAGASVDASSYLSSFGITVTAVSAGASSRIANIVGSVTIPVSGSNAIAWGPPVTNNDASINLNFATALLQFTFTRAAMTQGTANPAWTMTAFDAANNQLSTISQPLLITPGQTTFTLTGPGITRIRLDAFNSAHVTLNSPYLDDFILTTADAGVPEPSTMVLMAAGLSILGVARKRIGRKCQCLKTVPQK